MYLWNYRSLLSYSFIFYLILTHHMSLKCVKVEVVCSVEILFFPKLKKKFVAPPKSITNDVYLTPIEENLH